MLRPVDELRPYIALDRSSVLARLSLPASMLEPGAYGPTAGLEVAFAPSRSPARFYLQDGNVVLAYLSEPGVDSVAPAALASAYPSAVELPSRAGRSFAHHVDAAAGVAWSDDGAEVAFIEVFSPTDLVSWKSRFYEDPGVFYK